MSEASPQSAEDRSEPIFRIVPGAYGDTVVPAEQRVTLESIPTQDNKPVTRPELNNVTVYEMVQLALHDRLPATQPGVDDKRRDTFIKNFAWVPESEMEMVAAIGENRWGVPSLVRYLGGARKANGLDAARHVARKIEAIPYRATNSVLELKLAFTNGDPQNGEFLPSVFDSEHMLQDLIAEEIYDANCLNLATWPNRFIRRGKSAIRNKVVENHLVGIRDRMKHLTLEQKEVLTRRTLGHQQARIEFWSNQVELAKAHEQTSGLWAAAQSSS